MNKNTFLILVISIYFFIQIFKTLKIYDKRTPNKYYNLENDDYSYKITLKIIKDGQKNKVLNKKNKSKFPVYLLHGEKDNVVPQSLSRKILKVFPNSKKEFIKIKNGDHSLSRVKDLKILSNCMNKIIDYCAKPSL